MKESNFKVGLRIDVDTFRGTEQGVPKLLNILERYGIQASFFFSVGPDNMGRHLWRLIRPKFLVKMLRSNAASLYGWDILLKGTFWPGPKIGANLSEVIASAAEAGHEIGFHAWDHHAWQAKIERMSDESINAQISKGMDLISRATGSAPTTSASPGWRCTDQVLLQKERFGFIYNSDCRGLTAFYPVVNGVTLSTPQLPVTLPTYDEVIGQSGITDQNYNEYILSLLNTSGLNVYTIHAEVEGGSRAELFEDFLKLACNRGISFCSLRDCLPSPEQIPLGSMSLNQYPGREGLLAVQSSQLERAA